MKNLTKLSIFFFILFTCKQTIKAQCTNEALYFDGDDDQVNINLSSSYTEFTISAWFYSPSATNGGHEDRIFSLGNTGPRLEIGLEKAGPNAGHLWVYDQLTGLNSNFPTGSLHDDSWHQVVFRRNNSNRVILLDNVMIHTWTSNTNFDNSGRFVIGDWAGGSFTGEFKGMIDDVTFHDIALTDIQVTDLYSCSPVGNEPNLISYWTFENGDPGNNNISLTTTPNIASGLNSLADGTLQNFALTGTTSNFVCPVSPYVQACNGCTHPDQVALDSFYTATNGAIWINNTGWLTDCDPCGITSGTPWHGIVCQNDRVTELNLVANGLTGMLPPEMDQLTSLERINFTSNNLTGSLPTELCTLPLEYIAVFSNNMSGDVPPCIADILTLELISLASNSFTGALPLFDIDNTNLWNIRLYNNDFTGGIPPEYGDIPALTDVLLYNNQLTGCFDSNLSSLCTVNYDFTSNVGLPGGGDFVAFCANGTGDCTVCNHADFVALEVLYNSTNGNNWINNTGWLQDCDPCGIASGTPWFGIVCQNDRVTELDLSSNDLNGTLPSEIGDFSNLTVLNLRFNLLNGSIPNTLGNLSNLITLKLEGNQQINGTIPITLENLTALEELNLFNNQLSGSIPAELGSLTNLKKLWLQSNQLSGSIPVTFGNMISLEQMILPDNQLSGSIPAELGNLHSLIDMDISFNQLSGSIPAELGNLPNLNSIRLENNLLSGCFDSNLFSLCTINYDFSDNTGLPGGGDFAAFCITGIGECCQLTINLTGDISSDTYHADMELSSTGAVLLDSIVIFKAEQCINLNSGFEVQVGGDFTAEMEACPN